MTARTDNDLAELGARLCELARLAEAGGAERAWLEEVMAALMDALVDPRRKRALDLGRRMRAARESGCTVSEIAERFGRSPRAVHRLLADVTRSRGTVSVYKPRQWNRRTR